MLPLRRLQLLLLRQRRRGRSGAADVATTNANANSSGCSSGCAAGSGGGETYARRQSLLPLLCLTLALQAGMMKGDMLHSVHRAQMYMDARNK